MESEHGHAHPHHHAHPESEPAHVEFIGGRPIFNVQDVAASARYYTEQLGFACSWLWSQAGGFGAGAAPSFAQVMRGHAVLFLAQGEQGGPGMWVYLDLESAAEVDALHAEYAASGARIAEPPTDKPWGMRELRVQDLDGHTLRIGGPLGHERA